MTRFPQPAAALKKAAKKNKGKQKEEEQEDYQGEDMFTKLPVDILHEVRALSSSAPHETTRC